jgi:hypothetical protein
VWTRPTCTANGLKAVPEVEATWKKKENKKEKKEYLRKQ